VKGVSKRGDCGLGLVSGSGDGGGGEQQQEDTPPPAQPICRDLSLQEHPCCRVQLLRRKKVKVTIVHVRTTFFWMDNRYQRIFYCRHFIWDISPLWGVCGFKFEKPREKNDFSFLEISRIGMIFLFLR
jgi:hypothetical protein